jgi:hypothetical protein
MSLISFGIDSSLIPLSRIFIASSSDSAFFNLFRKSNNLIIWSFCSSVYTSGFSYISLLILFNSPEGNPSGVSIITSKLSSSSSEPSSLEVSSKGRSPSAVSISLLRLSLLSSEDIVTIGFPVERSIGGSFSNSSLGLYFTSSFSLGSISSSSFTCSSEYFLIALLLYSSL